MLGHWLPTPVVVSRVGPGARRTLVADGRTVERYPTSYGPEDSLVGHLRFALRYEPTDLGVLLAAFNTAGAAQVVEAWIRSEPTGAYARRAWFLFEWLTGRTLDVPDAGAVGYVPTPRKRRAASRSSTRRRRASVQGASSPRSGQPVRLSRSTRAAWSPCKTPSSTRATRQRGSGISSTSSARPWAATARSSTLSARNRKTCRS